MMGEEVPPDLMYTERCAGATREKEVFTSLCFLPDAFFFGALSISSPSSAERSAEHAAARKVRWCSVGSR